MRGIVALCQVKGIWLLQESFNTMMLNIDWHN